MFVWGLTSQDIPQHGNLQKGKESHHHPSAVSSVDSIAHFGDTHNVMLARRPEERLRLGNLSCERTCEADLRSSEDKKYTARADHVTSDHVRHKEKPMIKSADDWCPNREGCIYSPRIPFTVRSAMISSFSNSTNWMRS